jgi:C-22 sterol desaturase
MAAGGDVTCILDGWIKSMMDGKSYLERKEQGLLRDGETAPMQLRDFSDTEIALTLFTFLFASQDASSSATTWLFQFLADRPDIMLKVREEQLRVREGDVDRRLTIDLIEQMTYTKAFVKETLRYRPPVLMVPYEVKKNFPVTPDYTIPKGSMVVPTLYPALHDPIAYPEPETFDPDRWITGDAEKHVKNWLVFGTGPHHCIGQQYVLLNLTAMIGKAAIKLDWDHRITPVSEKIKVFATIFPQDDCELVFTDRKRD